jgi:hypothetical protein
LTSPGNPNFPPVLGVAFADMDAGEAIFRGLRGRFGLDDADDNVRIVIARGARISNPHAYGISIGPSLNSLSREGDLVEFLSRTNLMQPSSSASLDSFLEAYSEHGRYLLAPAKFNGAVKAPEPNLDLGIMKYNLDIREGWRIGPNDPDVLLLDPEDPPVVPLDEPNPPALKALEWLISLRNRNSGD